MAVRDKNVLLTDAGENKPSQKALTYENFIPQNMVANNTKNTATTPTYVYASVAQPTYKATQPTYESALRQAKVNMGYLPKQPSGMPSSDYQKMLDMLERQKGNNANVGVGALAAGLNGAIGGLTGGNSANSGSSGGKSGSGGGNSYAQNYYNNSLNALQDAYAQKLASLQGNLESQRNALKSDYDLSKNSLTADAERALQEAYVNKMMNEKALEQQLNSQGLNGGATESTMASMMNNYGSSRNNINTAYASNLAQLENAYLNNLAMAQQSYNDAVAKAASDNANYRLELENALYKAMLG